MIRKAVICAGAVGLASVAGATTYNDNVGNHLSGGDLHDFFQSQGFDHLDIVSVDITNDAQFLYIDITMNADLDATTWGKPCIGIDTGTPGGNSNGWGRNIDWQRDIDFWVGTWTDDGGSGMGGELRTYAGGLWTLLDATYTTNTLISGSDAGHAAGVQHIKLDYTAMGLGIGSSFDFDVISTAGGSGDPGVDHLSSANPTTDDWANQSVAGTFATYTIIPSPGATALFGVAGLAAIRRRR